MLFYKVVEGLALVLPPGDFLTPQKPDRLVQARKQADYNTTNTVDSYTSKTTTGASVFPSATLRSAETHSFSRTPVEWNRLYNDVVDTDSVARFKLPSTNRASKKKKKKRFSRQFPYHPPPPPLL